MLTESNYVYFFNNYNYSNTTNKHQSKVRSLLGELNIKVDLVIESSQSLKIDDALNDAIILCENKISILKAAIAKKGSRKTTNENREKTIIELKEQIKNIKSL